MLPKDNLPPQPDTRRNTTTPPDLLSLIQQFNNLTAHLTSTSLASHKDSTSAATLLPRISALAQHISVLAAPPPEVVSTQAFTLNLNMCVRVCIELDIFRHLISATSPTKPITATSLATLTGAEPLLITRLMRAITGLHFADEVPSTNPSGNPTTYLPNAVTHAFATPALAAGFALVYDNAARPRSNLSAFLDFFRSNGYRCPTSATDGPYQLANACRGMTTFEHWTDVLGTGEIARFNLFMEMVRGGRRWWGDWFPVRAEGLLDWDSGGRGGVRGGGLSEDDKDGGDVLIVDIGGGHGQDLQKFASTFPDARGRLLNQDLPGVLAEIPSGGGDRLAPGKLDARIECMGYDFFTPQPVTGARVYFLHMVLHDWPDDDCVRILERVRDAMAPAQAHGGSRCFINDAVLPDAGAPLVATAFDITMMAHHSGLERSEAMWRALVGRVEGLEVVKVWNEPDTEGIVEVVRT